MSTNSLATARVVSIYKRNKQLLRDVMTIIGKKYSTKSSSSSSSLSSHTIPPVTAMLISTTCNCKYLKTKSHCCYIGRLLTKITATKAEHIFCSLAQSSISTVTIIPKVTLETTFSFDFH